MDDHKRHMHLWALRRIAFLILFVSLLPTLLGCAPQFATTPVPTKVVVVTRYAVFGVGYFTYEDGCLFKEIGDERSSLVWWPNLRPIVDEGKGIVEIITPNAEPVVIRLDEQLVHFSGGPTDFPRGPEFDVIDKNIGIDQCPPPYWLIGGPIKPQ